MKVEKTENEEGFFKLIKHNRLNVADVHIALKISKPTFYRKVKNQNFSDDELKILSAILKRNVSDLGKYFPNLVSKSTLFIEVEKKNKEREDNMRLQNRLLETELELKRCKAELEELRRKYISNLESSIMGKPKVKSEALLVGWLFANLLLQTKNTTRI